MQNHLVHPYIFELYKKNEIFKIEKLLSTLLPLSISAEWVQPSYYDALEMAKQRSNDWGFPVGVRAAADWQNCGTPTTAQGFDAGEELECSASTCMLKCPAGQIAVGKRRIRCRWKRKHGEALLIGVKIRALYHFQDFSGNLNWAHVKAVNRQIQLLQ